MAIDQTPRTRRMSHRRTVRRRGVPMLYALLSSGLVLAVVTLALVSPAPTTPPLAEVAPAPAEQLEVERIEQGSQFGDASGADGAECAFADAACEAGAAPQADPATGPTVVQTSAPGQYRSCTPGPGGPRQTPDPQAPPCIAEVFSGDNGGATSQGVTRDSIVVAVPASRVNEGGPIADQELLEAFAEHFNRYYELYGRRLVLEFVRSEDSARDPETARAFAREVAAVEPFASLDTATNQANFQLGLADAGVIALSGEQSFPLLGLDDHAQRSPYIWHVYPSIPASFRAVGDLACTSLVGRPARHASGDLESQQRRFGVLVQTYRTVRIAPDPFVNRVGACGVEVLVQEAGDESDASLDAALGRLRSDGVTTVFCSCYRLEVDFTESAERIGFTPEWLLAYDDLVGRGETRGSSLSHPAEQVGNAFGISPRLRRPGKTAGNEAQNHAEQYWFHALRDVDPDLAVPTNDAKRFYGHYAQLLLLATGIQAAGRT